MRKIICYIAMSLDGYIADQEGGVAWLTGDGSRPDAEVGYEAFLAGIDTVVLGRKTYEQIITTLSPNIWPYAGMKSYVATTGNLPEQEDVTMISGDVCGQIAALKEQSGKDIWLVGGTGLIEAFVKRDLIDLYDIAIIPTILGGGIRLFEDPSDEIPLTLTKLEQANGIILTSYTRRT